MKIVISDIDTVSNNDVDLSPFDKLGEVCIFPSTPAEELAERISDSDAIFCNKNVLTREVMEKCKNLKYIGLFATGYNNVDLKAAKEFGITVCNVPGYSTKAVAQQVFSYILAFSNKVLDYSKTVSEGYWIKSKLFTYFDFPTFELQDKTIGIIGYGGIGKGIRKIAEAFDMKVLVHTRTAPTDGVENVSLEKLLAESDFVTIHCPLTEETTGLIDYEKLSKMKKTAYLINTARGPIVCENDLIKALDEGIIAGAALDVISKEPMEKDNPLMGGKNLIITPHTAWAPVETRNRLIKMVAENFSCWEKGSPINVVIPAGRPR